MKLSIIIPVYQVEQTLPRCLDSIISQSFRDWQAILVDDGSTDGSAAICDDYAKRESRVQTIHLKRNSGLSAARNAGLDKAKGEYITFVDSDDYIAADTLKTLFETLAVHPDYDILEYPVYEHYGSKHIRLLQFPKREYTNMLAYWLEGQAYRHTYAWNKIYRKEVFQNVRFPKGRTFEDALTLPKLLRQCQTIATTDTGLYYYCYNPKGISHQATGKDLSNLLEAHTRAIADIRRSLKRRRNGKRLQEGLKDYYAHVLNIQLDVYRLCGTISPYFPILPFRHTLKLKLLHLIGLKRLCQLHKIFSRRR